VWAIHTHAGPVKGRYSLSRWWTRSVCCLTYPPNQYHTSSNID